MNSEEKIMKLKYAVMNSENHRAQKASRMQALKIARTQRTIRTSRDYLVLANSINGKKRIESRARINKILAEKTREQL